MTPHHLDCLNCGRRCEPSLALRCPDCEGLFRVEYGGEARGGGVLAWEPFSLGEGGTPLERVEAGDGFWAKLEFRSPTGSFKDRGAALLIGAAQAFGVREFVEDSSGNAGAALAAYGAAAGMRAHVFLPAHAPPHKLARIERYGIAHPIAGPRAAAAEAAHQYAQEHGLPFLSHNLSPYFSEGMKAVARELVQQLGGGPDHIVLPVGNGSLLIGLERGFAELREAGAVGSAPRLHAVQSESVAPLAAAFDGRSAGVARATVADGIAVAEPPRLAEMLAALRSSGGTAAAVPDAEILGAQAALHSCGLAVEPTAAAALPALEHLRAEGVIEAGQRVVVPLTGGA